MKSKKSLILLSIGSLAAVLLLNPSAAVAQAVNVDSIAVAGDGSRQVHFAAESTNYYVLYRSADLSEVSAPIQVMFGASPTTTMTDASPLQNSAYYRVRTVATNAPLDLDGDGTDDVAELMTGTDPLIGESSAPQLIINELDYDQIGTDTNEFVEIFNPSSSSVDLNGLAVVFINGANSLQYMRTNLSGSLAAGQYLVIGSTSVINALPEGTLSIAIPNNSIQNGAPDGVLIFNTANNSIVDALSYEGSITDAVITDIPGTFNLVEGTALATSVADSNSTEGSLSRLPNGMDSNDANSDWAFTPTPTPGAANIPSL